MPNLMHALVKEFGISPLRGFSKCHTDMDIAISIVKSFFRSSNRWHIHMSGCYLCLVI